MAKTWSNDPLNKLMVILAIILAFIVASWFWGWGLYVTAVFVLLVGYAYMKAPRRTWLTAAQVAEGADLTGKVALVTGATSGIGVETARVLALHGAHVYLVARNAQKLEASKAKMMQTLPQGSKVDLLTCDLADLENVKECAETFLQQESQLHILINNAGIMALPERTATKQGLESQVGVCHVGHFYLAKLLLPALKAAATPDVPARVVALSSSAHTYHEMSKLLDDANLETSPYDPSTAYGNAKCSNLLFASQFHKAYFASDHIAAFAVMPGGIFTGLQGNVNSWTMFKWMVISPFFFKSIEQGAATSVVCALTADPSDGGQYFENLKATERLAVVEQQAGADAAERLWTSTEALLTKLGF